MQREIKFRGKRLDNGEWVYGSLLISEHQEKNLEPLHYFICPLDKGYHRVIPETVGQYTGLKDKNGKEIYEGDIILAGYYKWKCKIVWDDKCARFIGLTNDKEVKIVYVDMVDKNNISAVEVIGNIRENPELLEVSE